MTHDPNDLEELAVFHTEGEAQLLVARLESAGIDAVVFATATGGIGFISDTTFPHGGAQVRVREADLPKAKSIYEEFLAENESDNSES
ncbi:MAG: putative signal transducing protein [Phycisphaerales bacterium]